MANEMAKADGAALEENHWEVINFLREYYEEYQIAPAVRVLTKEQLEYGCFHTETKGGAPPVTTGDSSSIV